MICPACGAFVADGTEVCPTCHYRLVSAHAAGRGEPRWCSSCGSPVPDGHDTCPVCGLPVEGAFDEDLGERFSVGRVTQEPKPDSTGFMSAIPPAPKKGESIPSDERLRHTRMVLLAAAFALVLVGGGVLYIFRPWDPNAYATHAMEDADTSQDGFPGQKPHLTSQDHIEELEYRAQIEQAKSDATEIFDHLEEQSVMLDESYEALQRYLERGYLSQADDLRASEVSAVMRELKESRATLEAIDFVDEPELVSRSEKIRVLVDYLDGAASVLSRACSATGQYDNSSDAVFEVRSILKGDAVTRGYEEWRELFANAYESQKQTT